MSVEATIPADAAARPPVVQLRGITKRFPGVVANDGIDFDVQAGEVHTLFGENGAGKSTLMRVLYGMYRPDAGEILIDGDPVTIGSPAAAIRHGIGMIHQHFMLVSTLTVAENMALGLKSSRGVLTDTRNVAERIGELAGEYRLQVDPNAYVWQLSVGERQRVEIIKALYRRVKVLVLDEPTAVLTPQEVTGLFGVLEKMVGEGLAVVFISHKVREVLALSDRITVLRAGRRVGTVPAADATERSLADLMVGHAVEALERPAGRAPGAVRLAVEGIAVRGDRGMVAVRDVSLEVREGEIVGIAGVSGNGQRELAEAIAGLRPLTAGSVTLDGNRIDRGPPAAARGAGLGYVPEERMRDGVVPDFSVEENLMLVDSRNATYVRGGFLREGAIRRHCRDLVSRFAVRTPRLATRTSNLSGGNIQKLILARELSGKPRVLLVAQPTRGIDIGASRYIHEQLLEQRQRGTAVLIISEDLDEVLAISDRVLVMYEGSVIGEADPRLISREEIGLMMAGVRVAAGAAPAGVG